MLVGSIGGLWCGGFRFWRLVWFDFGSPLRCLVIKLQLEVGLPVEVQQKANKTPMVEF